MALLPFRIKLCGVTTVDDAQCCAAAGADAVGLNFYPPSPRSIDLARAAEIVAALPLSVTSVGLFVNERAKQVNSVAAELGLSTVQLHGDEPPEYLAELSDHLSIIRAYRFGGWGELLGDLEKCDRAGRLPAALLIDAKVSGSFGGTGKQADWQTLANRPDNLPPIPMLLAGGLTPENVAEAIQQVCPWGVDTAGGIEQSPGRKSPEKVVAFVAAAQKALAPS